MKDTNDMDEKQTLKDRTQARLGKMTPDERARYVSKCLMQAEWALEAVMDDVQTLRDGDNCKMAFVAMQVKGAYYGIKGAHVSLTEADAIVYDRPIPEVRGR